MGQLLLSEVLMRGTLLCGGAGDQRRPRRLSLCARGEVASPSGPQPSRRRGGRGGTRRPRPPPQPWPLGPAPHSPARAWAWRPLVFQQSCRPQGVALWLLKVWRKVCFRSGPSAVLSNTTFLPHGRPVPLGFWEAWGPPVRAGLRQDEMCGCVRGRGGGSPRPLLKRPEESLLVTYL